MSIKQLLAAGSAIGVILASGCTTPQSAPARPQPLPELPPLDAEQRTSLRPEPLERATQQRSQGPPVTLTASNVDIRALLPVLAEAAGISLVLGPAVRGRVSVNFRDVPALSALEAVLEQAGLGLVGHTFEPSWGPTVFYPIPVNIRHATAEMIQARYGVSAELARWVVEANAKEPPDR